MLTGSLLMRNPTGYSRNHLSETPPFHCSLSSHQEVSPVCFSIKCLPVQSTTMAKRFTTQLFVSRLSGYTTDQSLRQLFSPFGQIREARLIKDSQTQRPKGFGFVTFESEDDAQKAMKALDGKIIDGRLIFVEPSKEVEAAATDMNTVVTKLEESTHGSYKTS